ncbi:MAG: thiamine phosphate synthase [Peptococcaceae bacterium]
MPISEKKLTLYAVTDRKWLKDGQTLAGQVEQAILGGVTVVQLREKHADLEAFLALAREVKSVTDRYQVPLIINDNLEVALAVDAAGIHVGQEDLAADAVRQKIGDKKVLGVSAQTVEQALAAERAGADYLGVGAVFPTSSKADAVEVDFATLQAICRAVQIPVVAIGGITADNMTDLQDSGIVGVAVISAIFGQPDVKAAAQRLAAQWSRMRSV